MSATLSAAEALFDRLPRAQLGFFPTPLYRLENLSKELGVNLYIKRDDFTGMNLFGGNKVRKLEYLLGDAARRGATHVITYGATQSNHAMETAASCRRLGMQPILYLTAVVEPDEADVRSNLLLDRILGAEIHIVDILPGETEEDADARAAEMGAQRCRELNGSGHPCMDIPMGGANDLGSVGFARGYLELRAQLDALGISADYIFHATGTGGTLAGLLAGRSLLGGTEEIVPVAVSFKDDAYRDKVSGIANRVLDLLGAQERVRREDFDLERGYYLPGYEQPNAHASEAISLMARHEGLFIDPVYTGKAFAGLIGNVRSGRVKPGSNVVFWHTGGATALFAEQQILGKLY